MKLTLSPTPKNLREALEIEGFRFPCGGKGVCGRCRVKAPLIPPTALDYRFFSEAEINEGMRLACDKTIGGAMEIECYMQKAPAPRKLYDPTVSAVLGGTASEISIIEDGDIIETLVLPTPKPDTIKLRSLAGKNAVELYEKYGVAKASTMLVAGTPEIMEAFFGRGADISDYSRSGDTVEASLFDMPSEEVYLPPIPNGYMGSLELLELDGIPEGSLLILGGKAVKIIYKGETVAPISALLMEKAGESEARAVYAAIKYFGEQYDFSDIYLVGKLPSPIEARLQKGGIIYKTQESAATARAAAALSDNKFKTRLDKLARKAYALDLSEEERWQELLALS